jgi:hypothetical protein
MAQLLQTKGSEMDINLNDIKADLIKISEPHDGLLAAGSIQPVRRLFMSYLEDLQKHKKIFDFSIDTTTNPKSITYNVMIRMLQNRSPKQLRIHVGIYNRSEA